MALRNTASLLVILSPENTLADFPAGSTFLSPKASIFAGSLRNQSWIPFQGRKLHGALSCQREYTGQSAPDGLLLNSQEHWAVPHVNQNATAVLQL